MSKSCKTCNYETLDEDESPCNQCTRNMAKRFQDNWEPTEDEETEENA